MWATYLVVVETDALGRVARPIGVLTDRDLVLTLLARDVIPSAVSVGDVMTANPVTIRDSDSIEDALQKMREHGVRRMPVVGERGDLMGVLSTDDILRVLAWDTQDLVTTNAVERGWLKEAGGARGIRFMLIRYGPAHLRRSLSRRITPDASQLKY